MTYATPINEFDHVFELEHARRLRRRFLWYCGVSIAVSIPAMYPMFTEWQRQPDADMFFITGAVSALLTFILYGGAIVYAAKAPPRSSIILRLALWLYLIAGVISIIQLRVSMQSLPADARTIEVKVVDSPTTRQTEVTERQRAVLRTLQQPAVLYAITMPFALFFNHLFICLFMPWSLRESLRAVPVLFATTAAIFVVDRILNMIGWWGLIPLLGCAMAFVPGSLWCWWRFSKYRKDARLRFESRGFRQLQTELEGARRVHESQLPAPRLTGAVRLNYVYEPMRQIGGDLLFAHSTSAENETLSVVVLDVTGHGIAAALTVNRLVGELERTFAEKPDASPGEVLSAMNRYVRLTLASHNLYVTAICVNVDSASSKVTWASGGHPTAFLRRADGRIENLESTAMLLGVQDPHEFDAAPRESRFDVGDVLIAYTDGAAEARNMSTGFALGTAGVQKLLHDIGVSTHPANDWPGHIMRRVLDYRGTPPEDDTLVVAVYRS